MYGPGTIYVLYIRNGHIVLLRKYYFLDLINFYYAWRLLFGVQTVQIFVFTNRSDYFLKETKTNDRLKTGYR